MLCLQNSTCGCVLCLQTGHQPLREPSFQNDGMGPLDRAGGGDCPSPSSNPPDIPPHDGPQIVVTQQQPTMDQYVGLGTAFFLRALGPLQKGEPRAWHVRVADSPTEVSHGAIRYRKAEHLLLLWTRQTWQWHPWRDEYLGQFGGYSIDLPPTEDPAADRPVEEAPASEAQPPQEATTPQTDPAPQQQPQQPPSSKAPPPGIHPPTQADPGDESERSWPSHDATPPTGRRTLAATAAHTKQPPPRPDAEIRDIQSTYQH